MTVPRSEYDVVVVGARCAGAATALLLARRGVRTLVLERGRPGSDTLSTHALMRPGVLQLHRWGLLDAVRAHAPAVRQTVLHYGDEVVPVPVSPGDGVDALYAPRRTVLDQLLVDAAVEAGADVRHGHTVTGLRRGPDGSVAGVVVRTPDGRRQEVRAALTVGADGRGSRVARAVQAPTTWRGRARGAVAYAYWPGLPADGYAWHYRPGVGAGLIPTGDGLACVFVGAPPATPLLRVVEQVAGYGWDLPTLRGLLIELSQAVRAEHAAMTGRLQPAA